MSGSDLRMFPSMPMHKPAATFRSESGAFDLPSIMIGVAVVAILTVGVLAAIFGVIPWSQDKAAQQDLGAVHTAQGAAFAKDGGFMSRTGLAAAGFLVDDPDDGLDIRASADGRKYVGVSTSKTGKKFMISAEAPTSRPLTNQDEWPDGLPIDPSAPDAPAVEAGPADNSAILATYTCDIFTLNITQAMQTHSDRNQALKDEDKAGEMEPYPGGGWKIIVDASDVDPSYTGVFMTSSGEVDLESPEVTNAEGPALIFSFGDYCTSGMYDDGVLHSASEPALVLVQEGVFRHYEYYVNGREHRTDGPSYVYEYNDGTPPSGSYRLNGIHYPASERDAWIADGGSESGWPL